MHYATHVFFSLPKGSVISAMGNGATVDAAIASAYGACMADKLTMFPGPWRATVRNVYTFDAASRLVAAVTVK